MQKEIFSLFSLSSFRDCYILAKVTILSTLKLEKQYNESER